MYQLARVQISDERAEFLRKYQPWVRFQISKRGRRNFRRFMVELIQEFVRKADPRNEVESERLGYQIGNWNEEGGLGMIWVDNYYLLHCKMYLFDEKPSHSDKGNGLKYNGVLFRDHDGMEDRHKIFVVSDAFEKFLKEKGIKFQRYNQEAVRAKS